MDQSILVRLSNPRVQGRNVQARALERAMCLCAGRVKEKHICACLCSVDSRQSFVWPGLRYRNRTDKNLCTPHEQSLVNAILPEAFRLGSSEARRGHTWRKREARDVAGGAHTSRHDIFPEFLGLLFAERDLMPKKKEIEQTWV